MRRGKPIPKKIRDEVRERSGGICEAKLKGCFMIADQMHHILSRARGGKNEASNLLHLDHHCHFLITTHASGTARFRRHSWQRSDETEED